MKRGRLWGTRAYLCGPMDFATDGGITWRRHAAQWLEARGCTPFDPTDKPIDVGGETPEDRARRTQLLQDGKLDELAEEMKLLRCVDLRMVDITDFTIVYLDREQYPCGTFEELFLANREMKPVLIMSPHGPLKTSLWIYGTIPPSMIFHTWNDLYDYLDRVDGSDQAFDRMKRWYFFNQERVYKVVVQQTAKSIITDFLIENDDAHRWDIADDGELYINLKDLAARFGLNLGEITDALHRPETA